MNQILSGADTPDPDIARRTIREEISSQPIAFGNLSLLSLAQSLDLAVPPLAPDAQVRLYQNWIAAGGGRTGDGFGAWYNMGVIYSQHGDKQSAILAYRQSLLMKPDFTPAAINLGLALEALGSIEPALQAWRTALQTDADRVALLNQQGRLLEQLGRLDEGEQMLRRSLRIDSAQPDAIQHWLHLRQKMCQWPIIDSTLGLCDSDMMAFSGPIAVLALTDDIDVQREVTASWIARKTTPIAGQLASTPNARGSRTKKRIRIGYLSSDYCRHAISYLVAELFEGHDRARFEVFGYCSTRDDGSDIRQRVLAAFDHVRIIVDLDDERAARLIREDEIDILIDLNGLTAGSRLQLLRWRPAPLQATYLGFVGPVPLPELDATLCDDYVIPPAQAASYLPRPLPIAGIYQANDSHRVVLEGLTRHAAGLPEGRFVLCCFCGHFKITREIFAAWMSILRQAPGAILWLTDDNKWSRQSLRETAHAEGVDPERLVFANRCAPETYMARLGLADLFLDTFPYNAGTVASDAIRMKLPIVTMPGRSYASRMAAALLTAYGVTAGITENLDSYVRCAVTFANDPPLHQRHRGEFSAERWHATLGDSQAFCRSFEKSLLTMIDNAAAVADEHDEASSTLILSIN
ncbi:hypothetical protein [Lichenicola sp.]|uniref:O-linked N-acetylglucosamine transferase, SPINDLY family protein n=1 Tax=Lichenicola sp. TaxID=2804529 RepID=UPI003B005189